MENLEKLHVKYIDRINSFSPYDTNRECKNAKMNDEIASQSAQITKEVAIEFFKWVWESKYDKYDKFLDDIKTEIWLNRENLSEKEYTIEELFEEFLRTKQ